MTTEKNTGWRPAPSLGCPSAEGKDLEAPLYLRCGDDDTGQRVAGVYTEAEEQTGKLIEIIAWEGETPIGPAILGSLPDIDAVLIGMAIIRMPNNTDKAQREHDLKPTSDLQKAHQPGIVHIPTTVRTYHGKTKLGTQRVPTIVHATSRTAAAWLSALLLASEAVSQSSKRFRPYRAPKPAKAKEREKGKDTK